MPGNALIAKANGEYSIEQILEPKERKACSFERIYFSRGSDEKIYRERIALGHHLSKTVLENINYDLKNTIFSYIPNTAEVAFIGMLHGVHAFLDDWKTKELLNKKSEKEIKDLAKKLEAETGGHVFHRPWNGERINHFVFEKLVVFFQQHQYTIQQNHHFCD